MAEGRRRRRGVSLAVLAAAASAALAVRAPEHRPVDELLFRKPELTLDFGAEPASALAATAFAAGAPATAFAELGVAASQVHVDRGTGRFAALAPATPLVPGRGLGNTLAWADLGEAGAPRTVGEREQIVWRAVEAYLDRHAEALAIDRAELVRPGRVVALHDEFFNIHVERAVGGVPVRDSHLSATVKYGNLILLGVVAWGDVPALPAKIRTAEEAELALRDFVGDGRFGRRIKGIDLEWIPVSAGDRIDYRLAWVTWNDLGQPGGRYEALVDAVSGELLSLQDELQWATHRRVVGGVYPVSNDGTPPDGVEQAGWPMPYSSVTVGATTFVTDIGGNLPLCVDGTISATLAGPFVRALDDCGVASLSSGGDLDWSTSGGTNCTTPGSGGAGNTHASRTGYHELNMIREMAKGYLPTNAWLDGQLTANMNIVDTCNAGWNGTSVTFFRSGGGCFNTGEIAAVFDHEWGHGMDDNDAVPSIAGPGEAVADVYAALRLDTSCIGRGFKATNCTGFGDDCTDCTGVREIDFAKHDSELPALIAGTGGVVNNCPPTGSVGPCGKETHCEGMAPAEAVWDLWNRELTAAPYALDRDTAREIVAQLTFRGAGAISAWYTCDTAAAGGYTGGCTSSRAYQKYLAADDDDGNLGNGTPHMTAIYDAFVAHRVGCSTDTPVDSGCAGAPTAAPTVVATARDQGVDLSWNAVSGADSYRVYRTDGVFACDFGKILLATVDGTTFRDTGLQNGRPYSYQVLPMGEVDECFGVASSCASATPSSAGGGAVLSAVGLLATIVPLGGDDDAAVDNCEVARAVVPIANAGGGTLTDVRIVAASSPSHPSTTVLTALPKTIAASASACASASAVLDVLPVDLDPGDTLTLELEITSDQIFPATETVTVAFTAIENDFLFQATKTYSFEAGTEGWTTVSGTFNRSSSIAAPPGGGSFYEQSSANQASRCDVIRSPIVRLSASSTLALQNHFEIEPETDSWYDRANVGLVDVASGARTLVTPSSGRAYNASGPNGTCGIDGQAGWAGVNPSWAASLWNAAALQSAAFAGELAQLEVRYGTDSGDSRNGFRFDLVTLTDFEETIADAQSDSCVAGSALFRDDFELGSAAAWSATSF